MGEAKYELAGDNRGRRECRGGALHRELSARPARITTTDVRGRMHETDSRNEDGVDERLLLGVAAGIEDAFVELYRRRQHDVYRFAFAMARSRSFAQDVMQEVFVNVLENASRFDAKKGSVRAWLFGCARYVVLDRLRLERRWTFVGRADMGAAGARDVLRRINEASVFTTFRHPRWRYAAALTLGAEYLARELVMVERRGVEIDYCPKCCGVCGSAVESSTR